MNTFQQTFQHMLNSNDILHGPPPPLQPAPGVPPVPVLQPAPVVPAALPHVPTLQPAPVPPPFTSNTIEFIKSFRSKPKLIHDGHSYTFHTERQNGNVAWRCDLNNKAARNKGISCTSTAVTTGTSSTSTLEYAKPHSHAPNPGRIGAKKIRNITKDTASQEVREPSQMTSPQFWTFLTPSVTFQDPPYGDVTILNFII